jgi:hypothetical protein
MREHETTAEWSGWDGSGHELLTLGFETGGWTADGVISGTSVDGGIHYVVRLDERWRLRQFLLFRDLQEPDLWLGVDEQGRWGEVNGALRPELAGCTAVDLVATPFTNTLPIRRHRIEVGSFADVLVARVDHETLAVTAERQRYTRLDERRWRYDDESGFSAELEVDDRGLVLDYPDLFRRLV